MVTVLLIAALTVSAQARTPQRSAGLDVAIGAAIQDLASADSSRRLDAVTAIGHIALAVRPVARPADLLSAVGAPPPGHSAAVERLRAAVAPLDALLRDASSDARAKAEAIWALGAIGPDAAIAIDAIAAFLNDRTQPSTLRQNAPASLQRIAGAKSVAAIAAALDAERTDRLMVSAGLFALAQAGADGVVPLMNFLPNPDALLREWTVEALGRIGPPAATSRPALEKILLDEDPHLRSAALTALVRIFPQPAEIRQTLTAIVERNAEPRMMCETAVAALARLPDAPSADLHRCANHRRSPAAPPSQRYVVSCASPQARVEGAARGLAEISQAVTTLTLVATRVDRSGAVLDSKRGDVDTGAQGFDCTRVSVDPPDDSSRWPSIILEYATSHRGGGVTEIHWRALVDTGSMRMIQRLPERFTRTAVEGGAASDQIGVIAESASGGVLMYGRSSGQFRMVAGSPPALPLRFMKWPLAAQALPSGPLLIDADTVLNGPWISIETPPPPSQMTPPLGTTGAEAQQFWREQLKHPHLLVRLKAAEALARAAARDDDVLRGIVAIVETPSELSAAVGSILQPAASEAAPHVAALLSHPRRDVRIRAATVLADLGDAAIASISAAMNDRIKRLAILDANIYPLPSVDADALPGLIDALSECEEPQPAGSVKRCWDAIRMLTELGAPAAPARDRLRDLLQRSRDHQRILVAQALFGLGDEEAAWKVFTEFTASAEFAAPAFAAMMAADSGRARPILLSAFQSDMPAGSNAVVEAVKFLKVDPAVLMPIVKSMMGRPDHRSRIRAISVLASVRSAEALEVAAAALEDPEPQVRKTAYTIVEGYGAEALPWLRKVAMDRSNVKRESAILKMAMLGVAAAPALDDLKILAEDADERVRLAARNAVMAIQKKKL